MIQQEFFVNNMKCAGCAQQVKSKLQAVPNLEILQLDLANKTILLQFNPQTLSLKDFNQALADTHFSLVKPSTH